MSSISENWFIKSEQLQVISESEAKFILEHAEKQLKDTHEAALQIVTRSLSLLTISVGFIVAIIGFFIKEWETSQHTWNTLTITSVSLIVYLFVIIIVTCVNVLPKWYQSPGADPIDFFKSESLFVDSNSDHRLVLIYANEITEIQKKLNHNKPKNTKRWKLFKVTVILLSCTPLVLITFYLISLRLFGF